MAAAVALVPIGYLFLRTAQGGFGPWLDAVVSPRVGALAATSLALTAVVTALCLVIGVGAAFDYHAGTLRRAAFALWVPKDERSILPRNSLLMRTPGSLVLAGVLARSPTPPLSRSCPASRQSRRA